eukprot:TRINITY_DN93_c0_g2_i1.p1 TRINITY_DN93_c0_g2~~TRINITY_DN93_c0_g2_i1.p1  ORF type:complete len:1261 (-),score=421.67 TRINITY_DN93_c0_g2_i1:351-4133(-)
MTEKVKGEESKNSKEVDKGDSSKGIKMVSFFSLWRFSSAFDRICVIIGLIFSIGVGAMIPVEILVFGDLISDIQPSLTNGTLLESLLPTIRTIFFIGIANFVGGYIAQMMWIISGENQTMRIRKLYVHSILRQDNGWFDMAKEESLNTRLAADTQLIQEAISEKVGSTVQYSSQFFVGLIVAFIKGWRLALVVLATIPLLAIIGGITFTFVTKFQTKGQKAYAQAGSVAEQAFGGLRTIYSFSLQKRFQKRYEEKLEIALRENYWSGAFVGVGFGILIFVVFASYGLSLWYGAKLVRDGTDGMDGGKVLTVFLALVMGAFALMAMSPHLSSFGKGRAAAFQVFETIDRVPDIDTDRTDGERLKQVDGKITLEHIAFHYPSRPDVPILKDFSLEIPQGKTVAFVGPSGSGKSTIVSLVQRFYDPVMGSVSLDGVDIKRLNLKWLRKQIGIVSQEPVLFNMTIKENLLQGIAGEDRKVSDEEITDACKKANCHTFIRQLPKGYETIVGEHGGMLSGGQKQRIAIARAILKNPKILLLDEATSALDTTSERLVQQALDSMSKDRTTIIIAHRLSTIKNADLIVVMSKGEIVETGTHDSLYSLGGVYTQLVEKQKIKMKEDALVHSETLDEIDLESELQKERVEVVKNVIDSENSMGETVITMDESKGKLKADDKNKSFFRRVIRMMRPDWHLLFFAMCGSLVNGGIWPIYGFLFSKVVAILSLPSSMENVGPFQGAYLYAFLFAILGLIGFFSYSIEYTLFEVVASRLAKKLRAKTFAHLMRQEVGFFDEEENSMGALTSALATEAGGVGDMITKVWGEVIQLVSALAISVIIAFIYSWRLTLVLLVAIPFIVFTATIEERAMGGYEDKTKKSFLKSGEVATEAFKEIRTVKSLTQEEYWENKYVSNILLPHKLAYRKAYLTSIGYGAHQAINMWTTALGFYAGVRFVEAGLADIEDVIVVSLVIILCAGMLGKAALFASKYSKGKRCAINTFKLLDRVSLIDPESEGEYPNELEGDIELENIEFRYPARKDANIFRGEFGFKARPKQTVALVGPSGCGKSTSIGLIERWYDPASGTVKVDGNNVKNYQLKGLRKHVSLVGQEPVLFDLSIGENIRYGSDSEITQEEVEEATKHANIHKFISELPEGYNTRVGDKGSQLSGGQKQRIAIARALVRKPKILLLDEATSALDSESEKLVQEALDRAVEGRTTIVIAHRLSTIQNADLICVVKDGKVVESGKHFELINLNGVYKGLVDQQDLSALS